MNKFNLIIIALIAVVAVLFVSMLPKNKQDQTTTTELSEIEDSSVPNNNNEEKEQNMPKTLSKPELTIDQNKTYTANLQTTEGLITIELNAKNTPVTVNNFVYLAKNGFYNNTIFHRVIKGFMIQGGDPEGDGTGGPGYRFADEPITGEYTRGTIAMANAGPNTNGSQFFIMHADYDLPRNYVIFGKVVKGIEVVDKIATATVTTSPMGEPSKPVNPVTVKTVEISEK